MSFSFSNFSEEKSYPTEGLVGQTFFKHDSCKSQENGGPTGTALLSINELIAESKKNHKRALVITITPGPFKTGETLPKSWMDTPAAKGCSTQLNTFEKTLAEAKLNADVYVLTIHSNEYVEELFENKKFIHLKFLSDYHGDIRKEWNLDTIEVDGNPYLARKSIVFRRDGKVKVIGFDTTKPVDAEAALAHVHAIATFITPKLGNSNKVTPVESEVSSSSIGLNFGSK